MDSITIIENSVEGPAAAFDRLRPVIERSIKYLAGTASVEGLWEQLSSGTIQFWAGRETFATSYVMQHELCRTLCVFLAGGNGQELLDVILPNIEAYARQCGCKSVHMDVRPGFIGRDDHTRRGYKAITVAVIKELAHG